MTPQEVEQHWAYRLTSWVLDHGQELLPLALVLGALLFVVCLAGVWLQAGARWVVVFWIWRRFLRGLRHRGGAGGHSEEYQAVMRSPGWRRTRAAAIRRAGRRCAWCRARGPLEGHHLSYARLGRERSGDVVALCKDCHARAHAR